MLLNMFFDLNKMNLLSGFFLDEGSIQYEHGTDKNTF